MNPNEFCYWLQGYIELTNSGPNSEKPGLSPEQLDCIKRHLDLIFVCKTKPPLPVSLSSMLCSDGIDQSILSSC